MSGLIPPGEITHRNSALGYLGHGGSLKEHGTGQVELVVHNIVHGGLVRGLVALSEGMIREMELLVSHAPLHRLTRFVELCVEC